MNYSKFIEDLQNEFFAALEKKTNWGRIELKLEFERATVRVLARYIERTGSAF